MILTESKYRDSTKFLVQNEFIWWKDVKHFNYLFIL